MQVSNGQIYSCMSKRKYKSRIDADLGIAEIWARKQLDLNKYKCPVCFNYHLTSRQKWTING